MYIQDLIPEMYQLYEIYSYFMFNLADKLGNIYYF